MKLGNGILFAIPCLIWGSTWYVIKFQIGDTDPLFSVSYRFFIAGAILLAYSLIRKLNLKFSLKQHFFLFLQGICLFGLNYWLVYMAEEHLTSGLVAVVFSGLIFLNIFFNKLILKAPLQRKVLFGAIIGLIGMVLIFNNELVSIDLNNENFKALLLSFLSVILASLGNILSAYNQKSGAPVIQTNTYGMLYGCVTLLLIGLLSGKSLTIDYNVPYLFSLGILAVFGSIIAFGAYLKLLGNIGPDRSGYISMVMPVIALGISTIFEDYRWSATSLIGLVLILSGIALALKRKKEQFVLK